MARLSVFLSLLICIGGCVSGGMAYQPPVATAALSNSKMVSRPRDQVWAAAVPALGKTFYVINTVDKSSGLINVSFSGNVDRYVDCGSLTARFHNLSVNQDKTFSAASPEEHYATYINGTALNVQRRMHLEGRVNIVFEEIGASATRVTANVRYVVTRAVVVSTVYPPSSRTFESVINFNSGGDASFPGAVGGPGGDAVRCIASGQAEIDILALIQ